MDELDRDVLRVGGGGAAAEREKAAAGKKPLGHLLAGARQPIGLAIEQRARDWISREQPVGDERLQVDSGHGHDQQILGSGSPTSMSTTRVPP